MKPTVKTILNQPSWVIRSKTVELAITQLGGHMAPVKFYRSAARPFMPYYISPWQNENRKVSLPILRPLRGDFFCMPFGDNSEEFRGEQHSPHGETPSRKWTLAGMKKTGKSTTLSLSMKTKVRPGKVTKNLTLVDGHNVIYSQHILEGFSGPMPLGHHSTLAMPDQPESVLVATSAFKFGMTAPDVFGNPASGEYQSFDRCKRFTSLARVPMLTRDKPFGDCTAFPTRKGFTDLLAVYHKAARTPSWTAATFTGDGYLWFTLKDPATLPALTMWISNHGRHCEPWNGENCCLGLEDVCAYFAQGLVPSAKANALTRSGVATTLKLSPGKPTVINYIAGAVKVPRGFGKVRRASFGPGKVTFFGASSKSVTARVSHKFIYSGEI